MLSLRKKNNVQSSKKGRRLIHKGRFYWLQTFKRGLVDTFYEYADCTEVNGIWMLRKNRANGILRWLWATILILLFVLGIYLSIKLWTKFYSAPTLTTIATNLAITDVAFPGITLCNPQAIIEKKVKDFVARIEIPPEYTEDELMAGLVYLDSFTTRQMESLNETLFQVVDESLELNNLTVYETVLEISAGCKDMLQHCFWGASEFPCDQSHEYLSFSTSTSHLGFCCSFNYNPNNQSYTPFSSNLFGIHGGLNMIGLEGSGENVSTGLVLLIHHPMDYASESAASVTLKTNSESFVEIYPIEHSSSNEVLELTRDKRNCLTADDVDLAIYRQSSCALACQSEAIYSLCECHPYHLPIFNKEQKIRECKLKDASCYSTNYDSFKNVKCEHCLPNCYDVTYSTANYFTDLKQHSFSVSNIHALYDLTTDNFVARVYLAKQVVPSSRKIIVMSWMSLLFYPSRREFIATYVDNKKKNAGITGLQNTKNTFRLTEPTPSTEPNQKPTLLFTSNFKKFVADIENHLSEILSNDRKIDNIHSAMNDINKLSTQNNNNNSGERPKSPETVEPKEQINIDLSSIKSPRAEKSDSSNSNSNNINNSNNKNKTKTKNRKNMAKGVNIKNRNENAKQEKTTSNPPPSPQDRNQKAVAHIPGPAPIVKNKKSLESQLKIKITSNYRTVVINREAFNSWYFKKYLSKPISERQREPGKYIAKAPKDNNNNSITTTRASKLRENFFKYKTNNATTQNNVVGMPVAVVNLNTIQ